MRDGFIKVAAVTPDIRVADCEYNDRTDLQKNERSGSPWQ